MMPELIAKKEGTREKCDECGEVLPAMALIKVCIKCLTRRHRNIMLVREREAWDIKRPRDIATAQAQGQLMHLVLGVDSSMTWCGQRATTQKHRRPWVDPNNLPREVYIGYKAHAICTDCKAALEQLIKLYEKELLT